MWFEDLSQIPEIAKKSGTTVFVVPDEEKVEIPQAIVLRPEEGKTIITIKQVREMLAGAGLKQITERLVVMRPAEKMGLEAANTLLKNLEEPGEKTHYILITAAPSRLLPTILSRAMVYFWRPGQKMKLEIDADKKQLDLAKKLMVAETAEVVAIAEKMAKVKENKQQRALEVLGLAIEMLYKSYFLTEKAVFVEKIPKFLRAYENISQNGQIKLQIVANLV